ncbi:MAG: hypothetical protein ACK6CP_08655 [Pseudanabaena sp.]
MTNIDDPSFLDQELDNRDLEEKRLSDDLIFDSTINQKLAQIKKGAIQTLYIISEAFPKKLQVTEIATRSSFHRSTIGAHCSDLVVHDLIEQEILVGTENKFKPTHLYWLKPNQNRDAIREIFEAQSKKDSSLAIKEESFNLEDDISTDEELLEYLCIRESEIIRQVSDLERQMANCQQQLAFLKKDKNAIQEIIAETKKVNLIRDQVRSKYFGQTEAITSSQILLKPVMSN